LVFSISYTVIYIYIYPFSNQSHTLPSHRI
jgi:hypothetical protein